MQAIEIFVLGLYVTTIEVPDGLIDEDINTRVAEYLENNTEWDYA